MENFCEAFGVTKIEAPSAVHKRFNKKRAQNKRPSRPQPFVKRPTPETKLRSKGKAAKKQKKPIVCCKCGKLATNPFNAKRSRRLMNYFLGNRNSRKNYSLSLFKTNLKKVKMSIIMSLV